MQDGQLWRRLAGLFKACVSKDPRTAKSRSKRRRPARWPSEAGWRRQCLVESLECRVALSATPTTIAVAASQNQAIYGQDVTLTATVAASPTPPSEGTVSFMDGADTVGTASVSSGTATLTNVRLGAGNHLLTASYSDSLGNYAASSTTDPGNSLITTVAGGAGAGYSGDNGSATAAALLYPKSIAVDSAGNLFIADTSNKRIREVHHDTGIITTVAGNGIAGYGGDGGDATTAELNYPAGIAVDSAENLFIVDSLNNRIREVHHDTGIITTAAGNGTAGYGGDGGDATAAEINSPEGIAVDSAGDLFIVDTFNNRIREVHHDTGIITTVAGNGTKGYGGDNGSATAAELNFPARIAVDSAGNLFIADEDNQRIREVNAATGDITTVAGDGLGGYSGDGQLAIFEELDSPAGIAVDSSGNLFIADGFNNRIREVDHDTGIISTLAGSGSYGFGGDGGIAVSAELKNPLGIALDSEGNLFVADENNHRIREISKGAPLIVTPAALTITADNQSKDYGTAVPTLTASFAGFVNGDSASSLTAPPTLSTTATATSPVAGSPYTITASGAVAPNYTITYVNGSLTVRPAPVAANDEYVIGSGTITVAAGNGVLANDSPSSGLSVQAGSVTGAAGGTFLFNSDGSFTYTPPATFFGYDHAQYTVSDGLGDTKTATVTVLSQAGGVVWKFYESVLGRDADDGGLRYWINDLAHGGTTGDMAVAFSESDELLNQVIAGYYQRFLGRMPDAAGLNSWKLLWRATGGPEIVEAGLAASPEFNHSSGDATGAWLISLYQRVLDRAPDALGLQYWQQKLATGTTELAVALAFFDSPEAYGDDVTGWFGEYFGVKPTTGQLNFYTNEMLAGRSDAAIEQQLAGVPIYATNPPPAPLGAAVPLPDYLSWYAP